MAIAAALILGGLWLDIRFETQAVNRIVNEVSELRDPSPFRAALLGHLGKIRLSLQGYLRSPDPGLEKQVNDSRDEFQALLPEFVKQNPKLFPQTAAEEIKRTFGLFKEAMERTMENNSKRMELRGRLEKNFERILFLIDHNLRPMIRKDQADGEKRSHPQIRKSNARLAAKSGSGVDPALGHRQSYDQ